MDYRTYNLDESLGYIMSRAARALLNRLNRNFVEAGHDVTAEQWRILVHLWHQDGQRQQQLADTICQDKTSTTRLINGLEKRNLVVRIPDTIDRRQKLIYLTPKGKELQKDLIRLAQKTLDEAQQGIEPAHIDICKNVLQRVYRNLSNS